MKQISLFATMLLALSACTSEEYVGENTIPTGKETGTIAFTTSSKTLTRAGGSGAAASLNNNFVVFGYKTVSNATSTVFNNYQVNWVQNTAGTTESNSADWEYVGYKNLPVGVSTNVGVTAFSALTGSGQANASAVDQSIKYWDFSATAYDFFAYSLGVGSSSTWAKASAMSNSTYTLEGTAAQLGTCYISNKKNVTPSAAATEVELEFRSFLSKIDLKFYETIPGYSVKGVKFYPSSTGTSGTTPYLFASGDVLPTGGKYTVTFDENGKAQLTFDTSADSKTYASNIEFSETLTNYKGAEYKEASDSYLGRASNDATSTNQISVLPNPQNSNDLHLKIDFTLVSRDGTGEVINCTGATAVVPAAYAQWKPNYNYTYIFKISDNTNVQIGNVTGLYPITLDAVVTETEDGVQETITTVSEPSITTYAKGQVVTNNDEYTAGNPIYIVVNDGTNNLTLTNKANLYTVTLAKSTDEGDTPLATPAQSITEESVANALAKGTVTNETTWTVKDAHKWKMVVTKITDGNLTITDAIASTDSPTGEAITIGTNKVGKFTPAAGTNYVFQYEVEPAVPGTYDEASAAEYNATLPGAVSATDEVYSFTSFGTDTNTEYGTGKVKIISKENGVTIVEVVENDIEGFVGNRYKVNETDLTNVTSLVLSNLDDSATGISVKDIVSASYTAAEAKTHNATLPGAVSAGDSRTAVPAKYQYKVIKVASGS